jgi:hypothetical protein
MRKLNILLIIVLFATFLTACGGKSDADIQKEVSDKVKAYPGVTATVKDGVVSLSGLVQDQSMVKAAESAAKVEGVKEVKNNIQWKPAPTPMMPAGTPMGSPMSSPARPGASPARR